MIVQESDGGLLCFRQTDHALLSGAFAAAWGNNEIPAFVRRDETLIAATRHDDGWAEWELAPTLRDDGRPTDFIRIPLPEHVALYRRGIDLVEAENAYAGLVASLHGERLYTRPFEPGMDPRISRLQGTELDLATVYTEHERSRQKRLLHELGNGEIERAAEEAWRLLQVWDRLSLLVCMQPLREGTQRTLPPIASTRVDVTIDASANDVGEVILDPYPFADDPCSFEVLASRTHKREWGSENEFRSEFRLGEHVVVRFDCRSHGTPIDSSARDVAQLG